jgi:superfamily II DNA or RNA helicase
LQRLAKNKERNQLIVDLVKKEVNAGRQVLVFACSVQHASQLAVQSVLQGFQSASVDCYMRILVRRQVIDSFRRGDIAALFNYGVLSTGFDVPNIGTIVIARPTSSIVLYSQMLGRGLRGKTVGGTERCRVIDIKDNFESFGDVAEVYKHFGKFWS